ncbi:jg21275 [Pararge aegeria aegeria]|uniref:Jg21275 protein n=1 Tax=Pararge aegeria aegeria TaxID=348720 RepID=A0A8S4SIL2_9NEOP|nr:jg21275 [Pararge aegeria aegeria]
MRVRNFSTLRPKPQPASWLIINSERRVPDVQDVRRDSRQKSQGRKGPTPPYVWRVDKSQYAGVWDLQVVLITQPLMSRDEYLMDGSSADLVDLLRRLT